LIQDLSIFQVVDNTLSLLRRGLEEKARWQLSLWDAMILAAARQSGASELLTEVLFGDPSFISEIDSESDTPASGADLELVTWLVIQGDVI
jgi:hypothetical protein